MNYQPQLLVTPAVEVSVSSIMMVGFCSAIPKDSNLITTLLRFVIDEVHDSLAQGILFEVWMRITLWDGMYEGH